MPPVTSSNGQKVFCQIISQLCSYIHICEMCDRHIGLHNTLFPSLSYSLLFPLVSAVDKLLVLAYLLLRISKLEPYFYNIKSAQTTELVPFKSCFKGIMLIHDAFVLLQQHNMGTKMCLHFEMTIVPVI